jgi:hypothetical protein
MDRYSANTNERQHGIVSTVAAIGIALGLAMVLTGGWAMPDGARAFFHDTTTPMELR